MKKLNSILGITVLSISLAACGGDSHDDKVALESAVNSIPVDTTPVTVDEINKFKFDFAIANIPSPAQSIEELSKWGVAYNNAILNGTKNSNKYTTEFSRAINLGIYNIDMCYAIVSENGQDVLKYMKTVVQSSDALGLKGAVDQMIGKRVEQNISSKDSLLYILDELLIKSDGYLRTNERLYTASTIFAGAWIESLYLTTKLAEATTDVSLKTKAYKHLWEQRFHLGNLITVMDDYKDKKEALDLNAEFKIIHSEINAIKKAEDMTDANFASVSTKINDLRAKLVK